MKFCKKRNAEWLLKKHINFGKAWRPKYAKKKNCKKKTTSYIQEQYFNGSGGDGIFSPSWHWTFHPLLTVTSFHRLGGKLIKSGGVSFPVWETLVCFVQTLCNFEQFHPFLAGNQTACKQRLKKTAKNLFSNNQWTEVNIQNYGSFLYFNESTIWPKLRLKDILQHYFESRALILMQDFYFFLSVWLKNSEKKKTRERSLINANASVWKKKKPKNAEKCSRVYNVYLKTGPSVFAVMCEKRKNHLKTSGQSLWGCVKTSKSVNLTLKRPFDRCPTGLSHTFRWPPLSIISMASHRNGDEFRLLMIFRIYAMISSSSKKNW